jgi:hypothetical protein
MAQPTIDPAKHTGPKPNVVRRERVRALYLAGYSLNAVALQLNVTRQAVQSLLVRMGVPRRPRGGNQGTHSRQRK